MYARVLRKWSLNTNLMSFLWLAVVTLLLLVASAPPTTSTSTSTSISSTSTKASASSSTISMSLSMSTKPPTTTVIRTTIKRSPPSSQALLPAPTSDPSSATSARRTQASSSSMAATLTPSTRLLPLLPRTPAAATSRRRVTWRGLAGAATATATMDIPARNAGVGEESFYIPVAVGNGFGVDSAEHRLTNSPSSSRSSSSKIRSNSRLISNSYNHQQQQQQPPVAGRPSNVAGATADSMAYAHYYRGGPDTPPIASRDFNEDEVDDNENEEEDGDDEEQEEDVEEELEEEEEEDNNNEESDESEEHVADSPVAAAATTILNNINNPNSEDNKPNRNNINNNNNHNNKQVPNVPNSQIFNLYKTLAADQKHQQQQQQLVFEAAAAGAAANVHSTKARRHIQESYLQQAPPQQQQQQQQQQQIVAARPTFHSPVRETAAKAKAAAPPASGVGVGVNATLPPYRYIIESFEIPATLPYAEFTEQQRRMLLHQQQLRRLRMLQQQAARSRRDSRAFGMSGGGSNSGYQQHFYNSQQQQQQPYQRLQQHASTYGSSSSNSNMKQHHGGNGNSNNNHHHHQNNQQRSHHQHQNQHQQQQQQQRKRRRYCSARDPAQLAFEAPTVFEGKIISMTPDRRANFSATVEVKEVFKQQIGFRLQKYLRLQFAYRNSSGECDIYREQLRPRGLVRGDELEQGRVYLLFVQQIDLGNFTILGQPIRKTRRVVEAVKNAVSENYAQLASIRSITASNRTVENGKELRIVCKVQGRPPPKVTWFKDHKSINRNRKLYQIVPFKKRSELIIRSFNSSDAGRYECRAKNKVNRNLERRAIVIKAYPVPRYETHLTGGTGHNCPPDAAEFCFNGGTCKLFVEIGSYSCICPEGFIGERCDRKEVNNMPPNPTYKTGYIADDPGAYDPDLDPGPVDREPIGQSYTSSEDVDDVGDVDEDDSGEEDEAKASMVAGF